MFDKMRTLMEGRPTLTDVVLHNAFERRRMAAERGSEHPLGQAIFEGTDAEGLTGTTETFMRGAGSGAKAQVDSRDLLVGTASL